MMVRGLQRGSEVVRHTVDISGATHTFAASRRVVIWSFGSIGILLVPLSVLAAVFPKGLGIYNTWTRIAVVAIVDALVALVFAFFAVAAARSRTEISAGKMTVRSGWQTRTVNITELREITLEVRRLGSSDNPPVWAPCAWLTNGDHIWMPGFVCGVASSPPKPGAAAALDELRALIGLPPPSAS